MFNDAQNSMEVKAINILTLQLECHFKSAKSLDDLQQTCQTQGQGPDLARESKAKMKMFTMLAKISTKKIPIHTCNKKE